MTFGPNVVVGVFVTLRLQRLLEPRVFIRSVARYEVKQNFDTLFVRVVYARDKFACQEPEKRGF